MKKKYTVLLAVLILAGAAVLFLQRGPGGEQFVTSAEPAEVSGLELVKYGSYKSNQINIAVITALTGDATEADDALFQARQRAVSARRFPAATVFRPPSS